MEEDKPVFKVPDRKRIKCLTCKYGMHNFLDMYCLKYDVKPSDVVYDNAECPKYEEIQDDYDY